MNIESARLLFVIGICFSYCLKSQCEKVNLCSCVRWIDGYFDLTNEFQRSFYNESDEDRIWFLVTNNGEYIEMSKVRAFVSVDNDPWFSILDDNGSVLAFGVEKIKFELNYRYLAINTPRVEGKPDLFRYVVNNEIILMGPKGEVNIYNSSGLLIKRDMSKENETRINVSYLPEGIYIVQCGNLSFKFKKK